MRISTAWAQQINVAAMSNQQTKLANLQQQLSTGLKVSVPADDPAAAARILGLDDTIAKTNQYQSNISTALGRLGLEESALATSGGILDRVKELTIQAMNETLSSKDRLAVKFEVDQLTQEMAGVANTQNANGEYIFSGDLSSVPAFAKNATTGNYDYQGAPQQRALQIGPTRQVADGDLGLNVFENVKSSSLAADQNGNRSIFNTLKALSDGLNATFNPTSGAITGDRFLRYGLDYSAAPASFTLTADGGAAVPITLNTKFTDIASMVAAINLQAGPTIQARSNGNRIEFASLTPGAASSIQINNTSGTFLTDAGFTNGQNKTGTVAQTLQTQFGDVLTDIAAAQDSILSARSSVGARLNALENQQSQNEKFIIDTKSTLSQTQDLDYADAISKFQLQNTALQAAQQAFGKVKGLSLFNYL